MPLFKVSHGEKSNTIEAVSDREAWAHFCDKNKVWPSPKVGKVVEVKAEAPAPAKVDQPKVTQPAAPVKPAPVPPVTKTVTPAHVGKI